jgi:hypothetical protein
MHSGKCNRRMHSGNCNRRMHSGDRNRRMHSGDRNRRMRSGTSRAAPQAPDAFRDLKLNPNPGDGTMRYETGTFELHDDDMMIRELSSAELHMVSGGRATVSADLVGDAIVDGSYHLDNLPGVFSVAQINGTITPFSGSPTLTLSANADTFS